MPVNVNFESMVEDTADFESMTEDTADVSLEPRAIRLDAVASVVKDSDRLNPTDTPAGRRRNRGRSAAESV